MRNLKRALSLAVSSVMLLGMMVVGSGALSYADVTSEHNEEAIGVMQAVSVMVGDENGNFNPDKNVTRAEMAVVMANLLDLQVEDFVGASIPFTDVPEWAHAYVAACYADGITGGISATQYGSNNSVTSVQAALMMMKALGYFQYAQDFGTDWQVATIKQASQIELFDGINSSRNAAMTRNEVAQIALNALEATMVESDGTSTTIVTGDITINTGDTKYVDRETTKYDYTEKNGKYNADTSEKTLQLCENLYGSDLRKIDKEDSFGRPGTTWVYDGDDVAFGSDEPVAVYAGEDFDKDVVKDLEDDYTGLSDDKIVYNGGDDNSVTLKALQESRKGYSIEIYANDKDEITAIVVTEPYVAVVNTVETNDDDEVTKVTLDIWEASKKGTAETIEIVAEDDEDAYALVKGYEEDDVLVVFLAPGWDADPDMDDALLAVDDVETMEGKVSAKGADDKYNGWLRIDGERYYFAWEYSQNPVKSGDEGTFYLYNGYIVHYDGESAKSEDYLFVVRSGFREGDFAGDEVYYAEVVYADGTSEVIDTDQAYAASNVYTYKYNDSDEVYELTNAGADKKNAKIEKGKTAIDGTNTADSQTVYVVIEREKVDGEKVDANQQYKFKDADVYTGYKNVPTMSKDAISFTVAEKGKAADYVFIPQGSAVGSASDMIYIAGASVSEEIEDDDLDAKYYTFNAVVDGEIVEIMVDSAEVTFDKKGNCKLTGLYDNYTVNDDGIYSDLDPATEGEDEDYLESVGADFKKASNEVITIGESTMGYTDDVVVYVISADGDITEGSINRNYSKNANIVYTVDDDGAVTALYIVRQ